MNKTQSLYMLFVWTILAYFVANFLVLLHAFGSFVGIDTFSTTALLTQIKNGNSVFDEIFKGFLYTLPIVGLIVIGILRQKTEKNIYGNASFANGSDIKKMGLLSQEGIIIGKDKTNLLKLNSPTFISLAAPTGSGKGISFVIPNLLEWKQSVVVLDIKSENFQITGKYRKYILKQEIFKFDPFSYETHRYNPLGYVDMKDLKYRDIELSKVASILYPTTGNADKDFWPLSSRNLFYAYAHMIHDLLNNDEAMEVLESSNFTPEFTLAGILDIAQNFKIRSEDEGEVIETDEIEFIVEFLGEIGAISNSTIKKFNSYIGLVKSSEQTASNVFISFSTPLNFFLENEVIRNATRTNDFDLRDVRKKKMTIYLIVMPDNLTLVGALFKIFWTQFFGLNTKEEMKSNDDLKYLCLTLMDEFTSPGRIETYEKSVAFMRSFGLRSIIIYQDDAQLEKSVADGGYGKDGAKSLLANHSCKIYFTPDRQQAENLSKILGYRTVKDKSRSNSGINKLSGSSSRSISNKQRALMLPQEIMQMDNKKEIIVIANEKPIFCNKAIYFSDSYFVDKLKQVSPMLRDIKGLPTEDDYANAITSGDLPIPSKYLNFKGEENEDNDNNINSD